MNCQICGALTKKSTSKFCSIECKCKSQQGKRKKLDPCKNIQCKIDGKVFKDYLNRSGALTEYSKIVLKKDFDWNDWEIVSIKQKPTWNCPYCDWNSVDLQNKSGWITTHLETVHDLFPEQHCEQYPNDKILWNHRWKQLERIDFLSENEKNRIQCLECGEWMISITNTHLKNRHNGMSKLQYRKKHGIDVLSSVDFRNRLSVQYYNNENLLNSNVWRSKYEIEICNILNEYQIEHLPNYKKFGMDLDTFVPEYNLAIEFNGLYYHSELGGGKLENYHKNKTRLSEDNGIHLIHIFEDEWIHKKEIVISRLLNLVGKTQTSIQARKCLIKEVTYKNAATFLDQNHLQGKNTNSKINIGLFYEDELVSLMTFTEPRNSTGQKEKIPGQFELLRFCNKLNTNVLGGANKLFSYFVKQYNPIKVHSYANRSWTSTIKENVYDKLGFTLTSLGSPNYWYLVEPMKRSHRFGYTKQSILKKFKNAKPELTEWENMIALGFDRIWDCGSLKYERVFDKTRLEINVIEQVESTKLQGTKIRKRIRKETTRNIKNVQCKICLNEYSIVGMATHLKLQHYLKVNEYVEKYEEYRPGQLKFQQMLSKNGDKFQCKICKEVCRNEKHLTVHLEKTHELSKSQYVTQYILNGIIPKCKCGCGNDCSLIQQFPYFREFISGHNGRGKNNGMSGKTHSVESRMKMSKHRNK